jgi:hypothetical protein
LRAWRGGLCVFEEPPLRGAAAVIDWLGKSPKRRPAGGRLAFAFAGAAAFSFTGIFPFATVVTGFAATLALAGILPFARMGAFVGHGLKGDPGLSGCVGCISANRQRPGHKPGHCGTREECFGCFHVVFCFLTFEAPDGACAAARDSKWFDVRRRVLFNENYASFCRMELDFLTGAFSTVRIG